MYPLGEELQNREVLHDNVFRFRLLERRGRQEAGASYAGIVQVELHPDGV